MVRYVYGLLWFICLARIAAAQPIETVRVKTVPGPYLRFDKFTVQNEAFKQAENKALQLYDSAGYLWFLSTPNTEQALIRYDGNYYKSFGNKRWYAFGMDDRSVVCEDARHTIWAANENGLNRFDPITETFIPVRNPFVKHQDIGCWVMGPDKHWFLGQETDAWPVRPFYELDAQNLNVRRIIPTGVINGYTQQRLINLNVDFGPKATDSTGRLWGVVRASSHLAGPAYYNPATNELVVFFVNHFLAPKSTQNLNSGQWLDTVNEVLPDGPYVWLTSWNRMGLLRLDTRTNRWKQYFFSSPFFNRVFRMIRRNDHQYWLLTDSYPTLFDTRTETLYAYPGQPNNPFSPTPNASPYQPGRHASLWLGSSIVNDNNLFVLNEPKQFFTPREDTLKGLRVLYQRGSTRFCSYNTAHELIFSAYNTQTRQYIPLFRLPLNQLQEQYLFDALPDAKNRTVWLIGKTAAGGIFRFNEQTRQVTPVREPIENLPPGQNHTDDYDQFRAAVQDTDGNVWFASYGKQPGNLLKYDSRKGTFIGFRPGTHGLPGGSLRSATIDPTGTIWFGTRTGGQLVRFDPRTVRATGVLPAAKRDGTDLIKIISDPTHQCLWLARFEDGLWQYNPKTKAARQLLNEPVMDLHLTKTNRLWIKTLTALVCYDPATGRQLRFSTDFDLHDFREAPLSKTTDDEFYFGNFRFLDRRITPDTTKPKVVFSFVKVFDQELPLSKSLNHSNRINLNYDQNFFTVGFSVLSYFQSDYNRYAYQLEGFNKGWVLMGNKPLATFTNVPDGTYRLRIKGSNNEGSWSDERTITVHISPPFWRTWWFLLLSCLTLLGTVGLIYQFQVERQTLQARLQTEEAQRRQKEAELSEQEAAFKLKLSETEMTALRAQMNPHFIFNCLNSIQYFTARNDSERASEYLSKFARLIRLVLENSTAAKVSLQDELTTVELYVEMEAMRFPDKLHFRLMVDENVDVNGVEIPPMLLQPYVENAIWHGLMHKAEGGKLLIHVQEISETYVRISITDDGIGRAKAHEMKSKSAMNHKSFGMKITAERIAMINQLYDLQTNIEVLDLTDAQGRPAGTTVRIDIPIG